MKGISKRICATMLGGALFLSSIVGVMADEVLFPNGDFEGNENGVLYASDANGTTYDENGEFVGGWNGLSKSALVTDPETGNHYISLNGSSVRYKVPNGAITDTTAVYKLSYKYKHDSGAKMAFTFNQNTAQVKWALPQEYAGAAPGTAEWHTHSTFLSGVTIANNDYIRFGQSGTKPISGQWYLDDVTIEKLDNEIIFANNMELTAKSFYGKIYANTRGDSLNARTERIDPIATLAAAETDAETGARKVKAQVHYVTSTEETGETPLTVLSAVYKTVDGNKVLESIEISNATTTKVCNANKTSGFNNDETVVPMTSFSVPEITVPAKEVGTDYSVKVMVWNSGSNMNPIVESAEISD